MASNYLGFNVNYETESGVITSVGSGVSVYVYDTVAEADVSESPLTTDSNGDIAAGSFASVGAGTLVHFRVENYDGMAFSVSQVTTA